MKPAFRTAAFCVSAVLVACGAASAQPQKDKPQKRMVTWGPEKSPYVVSDYDCAKDNVVTVWIQGTIELVHPEDKVGLTPAPEILLKCDRFEFASNSKIITKAALYVRGDVSIAGHVDIENQRATNGADADVDPNMYTVIKKANGGRGADGGNGESAVDASLKYPGGRDADTGGAGHPGGRGEDGGVGASASGGRDGTPGANITLKARTYGKGTTIVLTSRGGAGGKGAAGGRGQDGGNGGVGGIGGKGGDAKVGRTAANGGVGGAGGDGGNGGWGGGGGDGGNGGRGGDSNVYIIAADLNKKGAPPSEYDHHLEGGKGGEPGLGGAPGHGGRGARGGWGGCGGEGSNLGPIVFHPSGSCAGQGPHGLDGRDGQPGPAGKWGRDGAPGTPGDWKIGFVLEQGGH